MPPWNGLIDRLKLKSYGRRQPLILLNGLAEQPESWFKNRRVWGRFFDVHAPNILVYDGPALHERIASDQAVTVDHLVSQLHLYLHNFVQNPPYHLVASSLGGKIAVEYAARYPEMVRRVVLICPSGMGDTEQLPIMEGVRRSDWNAVVKSVFYKPRFVDPEIVRYYRAAVLNRRWKTGLLRTVRGTLDHTVRAQLKQLKAPTLLISGANDKICCPKTAEEAAKDLPNGFFRSVAKCGHAPQIEKSRLINKLVVRFLTDPTPSAYPGWTPLLMAKPTRARQ
jgi:pimeloyl-ACP methyl ester carboxylesterase